MSSKFTGDAQPDAGPGGETDQTLPTEIVENLTAGAGALTVTEGTEPTAESGTAESEAAQRPMAEPAPGQPTEVMDAAGPADGAASAERPAGEDERGRGRGRGRGRRRGPRGSGRVPDPAEPTELIAMTEPVDMAEPVEMAQAARRPGGAGTAR